MKAIITGITGQDGSHMADLLLSKNYKVVGITRRSSSNNKERINHLVGNKSFELMEGDISDPHSVHEILRTHSDANEFYNFAAQSHVATSFNQPSYTFDMTGKSVINILQSIVDLGLKIKFYQASSSEMFGSNYDEKIIYSNEAFQVYGDNRVPYDVLFGIQRKTHRFQDEKTKFMPQSPYAVAKLAAHHSVRIYRQSHGLHASCGILFNHEGERRGENFVTRKITKWIGSYLKWLANNNITDDHISYQCESPDTDILYASGIQGSFPKLRLGNLDAKRDWGYAPDYMEAAWLMLQQDSPDDYVICTGETKSIRDFLSQAFSVVGIDDWEHLVYIDKAFYRPCEVDYLKGCSLKAKTKLGWEPKTSFENLVRIMVKNDTKL